MHAVTPPYSSKLSYLNKMLEECVQLRSMTKRNLQRLTGLLQVVTKVVHPGRPFLRTPGGRQPPRLLCAFKSGCQSKHHVVVCFHRKMEWHFNALGPGHVRSAPSSNSMHGLKCKLYLEYKKCEVNKNSIAIQNKSAMILHMQWVFICANSLSPGVQIKAPFKYSNKTHTFNKTCNMNSHYQFWRFLN